MMPNKIAFVGYAGSGKDYLAEYLIQEHNYQRIAFADEVKKFTHEMFPSIKEFYSHEEKDTSLNITISNKLITKTPREVWIELSRPITDIDDEFFLKRTLQNITQDKVIITDVRRYQEWKHLSEAGYTLIYIHADGITSKNAFDDQILDFKKKLSYNFTNEFNGLESFKHFINDIT